MFAGFARLTGLTEVAGSALHAHKNDVIGLGVEDGVRRGGSDPRMFGRTDLDGPLNPASVQGDRTNAPGCHPSGVVLGQQGGVDRAGQVGSLRTRLLDVTVETGELGVTGGGQLTTGGADLLLLGGQAIDFRLGGLQCLHGGYLRVLKNTLTAAELVDLPLDGAQVPSAGSSRGEPLPQDLGTAHNLPDLILSAGRLRLGVGQIACGANGITPIGAQTPDGILDAAQDGQMGALM